MGNLVSVIEANFHVGKKNAAAARAALQGFGFDVTLRSGAIEGLDYPYDKLERDQDFDDVRAVFASIATSVRDGSVVRFRETGSDIVLHEFTFSDGKVARTSKKQKPAKAKRDNYTRAYALYFEKKYKAAIALLRAPEHAAAWHLLGDCHDELGRPEEAIAAYQRASEADPEDSSHPGDIARVQYERDRYADALVAVDRALAIDVALDFPIDENLRVIRLTSLHQLDRHAEALVEGPKLLELDPDAEGVHLILGIAAYELGRYREARKFFEQAIERERGAFGLLWLADTLIAQRKRDEAARHATAALKICTRELKKTPKAAILWSHKARALLVLGKPEDALAAAKKALAIDPDHEFAKRFAARALAALD